MKDMMEVLARRRMGGMMDRFGGMPSFDAAPPLDETLSPGLGEGAVAGNREAKMMQPPNQTYAYDPMKETGHGEGAPASFGRGDSATGDMQRNAGGGDTAPDGAAPDKVMMDSMGSSNSSGLRGRAMMEAKDRLAKSLQGTKGAS